MAPAAGSVIVTTTAATGARVNARAAGLVFSLPARSRAITSNRWLPAVRPVTVTVVSLANALHGPPSRRHEYCRLAAGVRLSVAPKLNVAVAWVIVSLGPAVIAVSGGVLSTITRRPSVARLPARSTAATVSVCAPSTVSVVGHVAVASTSAAGGAGASAPSSRRPLASISTAATSLPASAASACTITAPRTKPPAAGASREATGAIVSWTTASSVGAEREAVAARGGGEHRDGALGIRARARR